MSLLSSVTQGVQVLPRRVMVYGVHGIGKSTFGAMAPDPIFIQTEDGLANLGAARFPLAESFEQVMASITALYTELHDYATVVIDSIDWLEQLIWKQVVRERGPGNKTAVGR